MTPRCRGMTLTGVRARKTQTTSFAVALYFTHVVLEEWRLKIKGAAYPR